MQEKKPPQELLQETFQKAVSAVGGSLDTIIFEHPAELEKGDYATNVALVLAKEMKKNPKVLAEEIVAHIEKPEEVERIEVASIGFINIFLNRTYFRDAVRTILSKGEDWGKGEALTAKKVLIEYTDPNPFKVFHIGHLMPNVIGESIARLYTFVGADVRRANYQGDVGLHVAKCLWGLVKTGGNPRSVEDLAKAYTEGSKMYEEQEEAKQEIVQYNKMVYEKAREIEEAYRLGREASLARFEELYAILGTKFDYYFFESDTQVPGRMLVKEGLADGVFEESDGAVVYKGEAEGLHTRVCRTKEGLPTYAAKDLGLAILKAEKWDFDISISVTGVEQKEYFKVLISALGKLRPMLAKKMVHIPHGLMQFTTGKMSSRLGNVITGESLLENMLVLAREKVAERDISEAEKETIARAVAVSAIKYSILKQKAGKNIVFDPNQALSFEGDSGPYLQYAHTRAVSLLAKAKAQGVFPSTELAPREITALERVLYRFPEVVARACEMHEPHFVTTYLVELASLWNSWYAQEKVLDGRLEAPYKLALVEAVAHTLKNGLWVLGIEAPEKM